MIERLISSRHIPLWRWIYRRNILILMIHGVVDNRLQTTWQPFRKQLSVQNLESGLAVLAKYYHFISMDQAIAMLASQVPLQPYSLVLTFDDGYRNNVTHALPILQRHGVPATFFLSTGHVERREPYWYDRLDYAIQHLKKEQSVSFAGQDFLFRPNQEMSSRTIFTTLINAIKTNKPPYAETMQEVHQIANNFEENAGCRLIDIFEEDHSTAIMSWEEAKQVTDQGITIGSHTVDHAILDRLEEVFIREQLIVSKKVIEQCTGRQCSYFCYPNGNWNNKIISLVRKTGFVAAITTDNGANQVGDELLTLRRISFPET